MLAPDINTTQDKLTAAYSSILAVDSFAVTTQSIQIVKLPDEPDWLPDVREEIAELDDAADSWQLDRANIWSPVILAFKNYFSIFSAVATTLNPQTHQSAEFWIDMLSKTLLPAVNDSLNATEVSEKELQNRMQAFSVVLPQIDQSIAQGWTALANEEKAMLKLTQQLGALQANVEALGSKLNTDSIASGKTVAQSAVTMLYAAGAAGAEAAVPILGLVVAVLSIGKTFYDLISDDDQLISLMNQINAITAELTSDAVGMALTKSTLQTLYSVELQYVALRDALPALVDLWINEKTKIEDTIDALKAGAAPDQYIGILTLPQALTAWQTINTFVDQITTMDITVGEPVTLDIAKAEIRPTFATLSSL